jgi:competence protein ComEA
METIRKLLLATLLAVTLHSVAADPVNINSADKAALMQVRGVGEVRAQAIINYREKNGPFKSVDQLTEVEGIGMATIDANREILTVGSNEGNR